MSKAGIDIVTAEFFGAFDNRGGKAADVARIRRLVLPGGAIVNTGAAFTVYTVDEFIEPRQRLLTDGRLVEFSEWETSERTEIAGDIASRFSEYRKSGILDGEPFEGGRNQDLPVRPHPGGLADRSTRLVRPTLTAEPAICRYKCTPVAGLNVDQVQGRRQRWRPRERISAP